MAKLLIFSDTHFGNKQQSLNQLYELNKTVDFIITEAVKNKVEYAVFLGDLYHSRKELFVPALNASLDLIQRLKDSFKHTYFILGNHDIYFKENTEEHSLKFLTLFDSPKLSLIENTTKIVLDDKSLLLVPWLGNLSTVENESIDIMFGHLNIDTNSLKTYFAKNLGKTTETISDEMILTYFTEHELVNDSAENTEETINNAKFKPKDAFKFLKLDGVVYSGHFHHNDTFQRYGRKFTYVGSPLELSWGERESKHGFYILDLETGKDKFIQNNIAAKHILFTYSELETKSVTELEKLFKNNKSNYIQLNLDKVTDKDKETEIINLALKHCDQNKFKLDSNIVSDAITDFDSIINPNNITNKFEYITQYLSLVTDEELEERKVDRTKLLEMLREYYATATK